MTSNHPEKRTSRISVACRPSDLERMRKVAAEDGVSVAQLMRTLANRGWREYKDDRPSARPRVVV